MTYHSAKGLDFETVFLPQLNSNQVFWRGDGDIDQRLFFVGVTRSRNNLLMSYSASKPHRYVQAMPQDLLHLEDCASRQQRDAEPEYFF
jgi:superfamily I DNA/RNA helicase